MKKLLPTFLGIVFNNGTIFLRVKINKKSKWIIFDTGARITFIADFESEFPQVVQA